LPIPAPVISWWWLVQNWLWWEWIGIVEFGYGFANFGIGHGDW